MRCSSCVDRLRVAPGRQHQLRERELGRGRGRRRLLGRGLPIEAFRQHRVALGGRQAAGEQAQLGAALRERQIARDRLQLADRTRGVALFQPEQGGAEGPQRVGLDRLEQRQQHRAAGRSARSPA